MDRFDKIWRSGQKTGGIFVLLSLLLRLQPAGGQLPPDEEWRTVETSHFRVTFPRQLEGLARRAGERGERAWELLEERFVPGPEGKVDLLITDHADVSNGYSQVFPSNRIVIFAAPPVDGYSLTHMDEWMELVVTHELVHIFHEDRTRGPSSAFRKVFGRLPSRWPTFPGAAIPAWAIEGIATYYESALTKAGRVRGSFHDMVLRTAILEGGFESLNQVSSDAPSWPGGQRYYIYGSLFLDHLLDQHGEEAMGAFVDAVAGQWVPFRLDSAARHAFGESFTEAWGEWEEELGERYRALGDDLASMAPLTEGERLTEEGHYALSPAISPSGGEVAFSRYDSRSDPQLRILRPEEGSSRKLARLNSLANLSWTPEGEILYSQTEFSDPYRLRSDLYLASADGKVERLTRDRRLDHPHVAPDGRVAVAVQEGGGTNRLVRIDLGTGEVTPMSEFDPQAHWSYPRWSPDGRWIAVARWQPGAFFDIVLLDSRGEVVQEVTRDRAVDISPTWSPDGRWLLWSSDLTGIPNLHAISVDPNNGSVGERRQVTNLLGGGAYPAVDPEGRWIYYSGYHADGWHIERIPFHPQGWFDPLPPLPSLFQEVDTDRFQEEVTGTVQSYEPLRTLGPTFWMPAFREGEEAHGKEILRPGFGLSTYGEDLVGRHRYAVTALFASGPGRFTGGASYSWAGLGNPVLGVAATQSYDADGPFLAPDESEGLLYIVERERALGGAATFIRRRSRDVSSISFGGSYIWEERTLLDESLSESEDFFLNRPTSRLVEGRTLLSFGNARQHPFSISPEDGVGLFLRGRVRRELALPDSVREVAGDDRSFQDVMGQMTLYQSLPLPGFSHHVLALRGSGGIAQGPGADAFHFEMGGASGAAGGEILSLGSGLLFPLRGYPTSSRTGRYAWSASAEYRFPLLFLNGGPGLIPIHFDWISGSFFVDAGNAWGTTLEDPDHANPRTDTLLSAGAELTTRILPFWYHNLELRVGVGIPLVEGDGSRAYLRIGPAF